MVQAFGKRHTLSEADQRERVIWYLEELLGIENVPPTALLNWKVFFDEYDHEA